MCQHYIVKTLTSPLFLKLLNSQGYLWLPYDLAEVIELNGETLEPKRKTKSKISFMSFLHHCHSFHVTGHICESNQKLTFVAFIENLNFSIQSYFLTAYWNPPMALQLHNYLLNLPINQIQAIILVHQMQAIPIPPPFMSLQVKRHALNIDFLIYSDPNTSWVLIIV